MNASAVEIARAFRAAGEMVDGDGPIRVAGTETVIQGVPCVVDLGHAKHYLLMVLEPSGVVSYLHAQWHRWPVLWIYRDGLLEAIERFVQSVKLAEDRP